MFTCLRAYTREKVFLMSRILVVSPPELGHLLPVLPVAQRLREHGHEVVFLSTAETRWLLERYHFSTELWIEPAETTCCRTFSPPSHIPAGASFWYDFTRRSRSTKLDAIQKRLEAVAIRCCSEHFVMDSPLQGGMISQLPSRLRFCICVPTNLKCHPTSLNIHG
jgi:hypothetical protein